MMQFMHPINIINILLILLTWQNLFFPLYLLLPLKNVNHLQCIFIIKVRY